MALAMDGQQKCHQEGMANADRRKETSGKATEEVHGECERKYGIWKDCRKKMQRIGHSGEPKNRSSYLETKLETEEEEDDANLTYKNVNSTP